MFLRQLDVVISAELSCALLPVTSLILSLCRLCKVHERLGLTLSAADIPSSLCCADQINKSIFFGLGDL